jgi:hypothetical protein
MQTDDYEKKATPPRAWFKPEGWREREEAANASMAPRRRGKSDELALARC